MRGKAHIETFMFDGILGEQVNATVIDKDGKGVHGASVIVPVLRCKLWALFHGYGWPAVKS